MPVVACPSCGEDEELTGTSTTDAQGVERRELSCGRCGAEVTSSSPLPGPQPPPGSGTDLTELRRRGR